MRDVIAGVAGVEVAAEVRPGVDLPLDRLVLLEAAHGLERGDVVVEVCGQAVAEADFSAVWRLCGADFEPVTLKVFRPEDLAETHADGITRRE